jgi:hypothetical protein
MIPKIEGEGDTPIFSLEAIYSTLIAATPPGFIFRAGILSDVPSPS